MGKWKMGFEIELLPKTNCALFCLFIFYLPFVLTLQVSDNLRLPRKVYESLPEAEGRSVLSCWMPGHMEQMRRNKGKSMEESMLTEVRVSCKANYLSIYARQLSLSVRC